MGFDHYDNSNQLVFDGLLVKYWATIVGYGVMVSPLLLSRNSSADATKLTNDYIRNSSYLLALAAAVGQLVMIGNKITALAGFTSRVSELLEMVNHLSKVGNEPFEIVEDPGDASAANQDKEYKGAMVSKEWLEEWKRRRDAHREVIFNKPEMRRVPSGRISFDMQPTRGGKILKGDMIKFEHVDIVSPEGRLLVKGCS